jgi:hypothetical protein
MPVVFEEIVGRVEPDPTPTPALAQQAAQQPDARAELVRYELTALARRAARLRAD